MTLTCNDHPRGFMRTNRETVNFGPVIVLTSKTVCLNVFMCNVTNIHSLLIVCVKITLLS